MARKVPFHNITVRSLPQLYLTRLQQSSALARLMVHQLVRMISDIFNARSILFRLVQLLTIQSKSLVSA